MVSASVSWPLLAALSLTFLYSSLSLSGSLHLPQAFRFGSSLPTLLSLSPLSHILSFHLPGLSPSVCLFLPPFSACLSLSNTHTLAENNAAGVFFFFTFWTQLGGGAERMSDVCTSLWVSYAGGISAHLHHLLSPASPSSAWRILSPFQTHPFPVSLAAPLPGRPHRWMLPRPLTHTPRLWPLLGSLALSRWGGHKGTPPWVCAVWMPGKGTARALTCQCLVTAFHTPMRPVWLVAMSWFPTKNKASTGTPRWKTPVERKERSVRALLHR